MLRALSLIIPALSIFYLLPLNAVDTRDYLNPQAGTQRVAVSAGDTIGTSVVQVNSSITPTALVSAVTNGSRRSVCIQNASSLAILLGTTTLQDKSNYLLGESTSTSFRAEKCTNNSAAIYGVLNKGINNPGATIYIWTETQSVP